MLVSTLLLAVSGAVAPSPTPQAAALREGPPEPLPTISERAKDLRRHDGFLPFFWDARRGALLLEISDSRGDFLYGSGLAGGAGLLEVSLDRGQLGELGICRFERSGPRVLLEQRQTAHRSGVADRERTRAVEESFPSAVLAAFPVVAEEGDRVLVDATSFLLADTAVLPALKRAKLGEWKHDAARSALHFERSGAFPINTEIEAVLTFTSDDAPPEVARVLPDGRTMSLRVHHTFLRLPEPGYVPRRLDPRVGFLAQRHQDYAAPYPSPIERLLASRWRLEKKDPAAAVSEPVRPILFHLDRGMPEPERSAIRDAALWWNHAFERAGFREALIVRDLPPGATFLDARYSGIEWIHRAERSWSIGDFQADPRTGEILHAVARIDSHRRRTTSRMWRNFQPRDPRLACLAADAPDPSGLAAPGGSVDERTLVLQRLAYLSAHEVGHTLGVDHNWAATTFGWGSVMDYLAPNAQLRDGEIDLSNAYPRDVGSWDRFVIEWGYTPSSDPAALDRIVAGNYARGIVYPLEGDARWAEYDWGEVPSRWLATTQAVRRVILERFGPGQLAPGESVFALQERFSLAYLYHRFGIAAAQKSVGGRYETNALAGDGQVPIAPVPAARQREALELLVAALAPENLEVPDRIVASLVAPPSGTPRSREQFPSEAGEAFSPLTAARVLVGLVVDPLLEPERAARLTFARGPGALTLDEVFGRLVDATWGAKPAASQRQAALRRISQRGVLDAVMDLAARAETSPEARAAAFGRLERLRRMLRARRSPDPAEEGHVRLAERDVSEFLDHPEIRRSRPPRPAPPPGRPIGAGETAG